MVGVDVLSEPERRLCEAVGRGDHVDLRTGGASVGDPGAWGADRTIREGVLCSLLFGAVDSEVGCIPAVRLTGARVAGVLDLSDADVKLPFRFSECLFTDPPLLIWSRTRTAEFTTSVLPGFAARFAHVDGNLVMRECRITGKADLAGAQIGGQLDLRGARLSNPAGVVVDGEGLAVGASMSCQEGFSAEGEIRLVGARLVGGLEMNGAQLRNPGGRVLSADG